MNTGIFSFSNDGYFTVVCMRNLKIRYIACVGMGYIDIASYVIFSANLTQNSRVLICQLKRKEKHT